VLSVAYVI